ncbi:MAG: hypothetical protein LBV12_06270 [Puniceicoccales bacterium]|nr:hypothetical protein [Puniceicoccales bacterium]
MNSSSPEGDPSPKKSESPSPWIQGVLLGIFIGLAFIGGWMLARNAGKTEQNSPATAASSVSQPATLTPPAPEPVEPVPANPDPIPVAEPAKPVAEPPVVEVPKNPDIPDLPEIIDPLKPIPPPPPLEPAKLSIMTEPDAKVLMLHETDVRFLGNADKSGRLVISEKLTNLSETVSLLFQHPSCMVERRDNVELKAGQNLDVIVPMKYLPGSLTIVANSSAAELFLDGVSIGKGFVMIGEVTANVPHVVEVRAPNAEPVKRTVVVSPKSTTIERVSITPTSENTGDLILMGVASTLATQTGVVVTLNGKPVQVDQGLIRNVLPGDHTLAISTVPASENETSRTLWERQVRVEAGTATSLLDEPKQEPRIVASESTDGESAYLALTLLDSKNKLIRTNKTEISFNNTPILPRNDGTWPIPLGVAGTLRVSAPGYLTDERQLNFTEPGSYVITCVLHPGQSPSTTAPAQPAAPQPATWNVHVLAVSAEDGLLVLSATSGRTLIKGDRLRLTLADIADSIQLSVVDTSQGMVVCQILPGKTRPILPESRSEATVTNESPF